MNSPRFPLARWLTTRTVLTSFLCALLVSGCTSIEKPGQHGLHPSGPRENLQAKADPRESSRAPTELQRPLLSGLGTASPQPGRIPEKTDAQGRLNVPISREWNYIVIHHSYSQKGSEAIFDDYHRNVRGWLGVGYHFVIGNGNGSRNGLVEVTFRWEKQVHGAHAGVQKYNQHGIGICLVGNFEKSYPTAKQIQSLVSLVNYLQRRCDIPTSRILLHRHVRNTKCPGENFPFYQFISLLDH